MTVMTPIEGVTAPIIPAAPHADAAADPAAATAPAAEPSRYARYEKPFQTFLPADETPYASRRGNGWSVANQRLFLEGIAEGHGVEVATLRVGLSPASAYAFRRSAKGAAFALAWRAATLIARDAIAETLLVRALEGQVDTINRPDGSSISRHRHDNRLAMSLLARLDRQVEQAPDADIKAARLVAGEFDAFLDVLGQEASAARAGLFLARRAGPIDGAEDARDLTPIYALAATDRLVRTGVATAAEVDIADLDPTCRSTWTGEQWARAEAAGIVAVATASESASADPEPEGDAAAQIASASQHRQCSDDEQAPLDPVWWDSEQDCWCTSYPPTPEDGELEDWKHYALGHVAYSRRCTEAEAALLGSDPDHYSEAELDALAVERDAYFARLAAAMPPADRVSSPSVEPAAPQARAPQPTEPQPTEPTPTEPAEPSTGDPTPAPIDMPPSAASPADEADDDEDETDYFAVAFGLSSPSPSSPGPL